MNEEDKDKLIFGILPVVDDQDFITLIIDLVQARQEDMKNALIIAINRTKEYAWEHGSYHQTVYHLDVKIYYHPFGKPLYL